MSLRSCGPVSSSPAAGRNELQGFSLFECFSPPAPVPPRNHKAKDIPVFSLVNSPGILLNFYFLTRSAASQHKAPLRRVVLPPPASLGLFSFLCYPIIITFLLILHKQIQWLPAPHLGCASSLGQASSTDGGQGASAAPGQCSSSRAAQLHTSETHPVCTHGFVRVPQCLGLDSFLLKSHLEC